MADNFKSYDQAVIDGDVFVWGAGGDKLAKKERFDANTKFVVDNMNELWTKVNNAMIANAGTQTGLNSTVEDQILELQKITEGAPEAFDTLLEIANALDNAGDFATTVTNALGARYTKAESDLINTNFLNRDGSNTIAGDILPELADTYTLGSAEKPFKDLFVGPHSLYVDGVPVIQSEAGTIVVSADQDQNVQLKTSGGGDIEFYPDPNGTGAIQLKGSVQIPSNKFLMTSDNLPLQIGNSMTVDGDINTDDIVALKLNGTNIDTFLQDIVNLKTLVLSDDSALDDLQEIVEFIKANKSTLDTLAISNIAGLDDALDGKVDKAAGKGLSANDYTTVEKSKLSGIADNANNYSLPTASLVTVGGIKAGGHVNIDGAGYVTVKDNLHAHTITNVAGLQGKLDEKVDKTVGKGLSANDYSDAEKVKLAGIEAGATKYTHPSTHSIAEVAGLQATLVDLANAIADGGASAAESYLPIAGKAADSELLDGHDNTYFAKASDVRTSVPAGAVFTDTTYSNISEFTNDSGFRTNAEHALWETNFDAEHGTVADFLVSFNASK